MITTGRAIHRSYFELAIDGPVSVRQLAASVPVSPATIYYHVDSADELVRRAERRALAALRLACWGLNEGQQRFYAVFQALKRQAGLAELIVGYDRQHEPWPAAFSRSLLPHASSDEIAQQALSDLLGGLAHMKRCHPNARLILSRREAWTAAHLALAAVEREHARIDSEIECNDHMDDVLASTKIALDEPNPTWRRLLQSGVDSTLVEGEYAARKVRERAGVSTDSLYAMGGPRAMTERIDDTLRKIYLPRNVTWDFYTQLSNRILAFGADHPNFFAYIAKKRGPTPGHFDAWASQAMADARRRGWIRPESLRDDVLVSLGIGATVRRFHNRTIDPDPWANVVAYSLAFEHVLIHRTPQFASGVRSPDQVAANGVSASRNV